MFKVLETLTEIKFRESMPCGKDSGNYMCRFIGRSGGSQAHGGSSVLGGCLEESGDPQWARNPSGSRCSMEGADTPPCLGPQMRCVAPRDRALETKVWTARTRAQGHCVQSPLRHAGLRLPPTARMSNCAHRPHSAHNEYICGPVNITVYKKCLNKNFIT